MNNCVMVQVTTAVSSKDDACELTAKAVDEKLAACVQVIGPITSFYRWKDKKHREEEWLCIMKTLEDRVEKVMDFIRENHSYETPEIIVTPVLTALPAYRKWLDGQLEG